MTKDLIGPQIEILIAKAKWERAQTAIEKQLVKEPDDHWLWSRLSGVQYEQGDCQGALQAAEHALKIVPDCPLALWSKAEALEMLGKTEAAWRLYSQLMDRGLDELKNPDEDANECWEGPDWTVGLLADCVFRIAGCLVKGGRPYDAVKTYQTFLGLVDMGAKSIYSQEDAQARLKKLVRTKKAKREAAVRMMELMTSTSAVPDDQRPTSPSLSG